MTPLHLLWPAVTLAVAGGLVWAWRWWLRRRAPGDAAVARAWAECAGVAAGRPCWLVLGPTGGGKSSLLGESGLAWDVKPPPGVASVPQAWRHEGGALIELPGSWADGAAAHPGWLSWVALLRRHRRRQSVVGVVACIPLSDLLRRGATYTAAIAAALRERGAELAQACGRCPPLYLVLTKADHIGGYKDFFAGLSEAERQQVLGATLAWPLPEQPAQAWAGEFRALVEALRARRPLGLMRARDQDAARKLFQFPGQLDGLAGPVGELIAQASRPGREGWPLRGVYLVSSHRASPAAPPPTLRGVERTDLERSVYLGQSRARPSTGGTGHFTHVLLSAVLPADRGLARPTRDRRRLLRRLRRTALYIVPAAAATLALALVVDAWMGVARLRSVRTAGAEVQAMERLHPADAPRNLDALDRLGAALARLARSGGAARPALEAGSTLYVRRLSDLCARRSMTLLSEEIANLRASAQTETDRLYDAFRAYQMLTGAVPPDPVVLERELIATRRWYAALDQATTRLDWPTEVLARRQLEWLARDLLPRGLGRLDGDRGLVEATARELGEALWIRQGWDDVLREARNQFPRGEQAAAVGILVPGPQPEGALTRRAWDDVVRALADEKAVAIERTLASLSIRLDRDAVRRRLAERFRAEHRRAWLAALAGARVVPAEHPAAVPERAVEAAGPASSWPQLAKRTLDELDPPSALATLAGGARTPWIRPALDPLLEIKREVEGFLAATAEGRRSTELERVAALARRFDEVHAAASARLAEVQPDDLREALRDGLGGMVHGLWQAIDRAVTTELERTWAAEVVTAWRRDCAGRYPFADATDEVPLERFAAFANPRTGTLWLGLARIEGLRAITVAGRPALTLSRPYLDLVARAEAVRDGFFAGGGEQVVAPCHLTLVQREGVADIAVALGAQAVRLYDRPDARYPLVLRQGEPAGAKVAIRVVTGEWKSLEFPASAWGWLRLLRAGDPRATAAGGWTLTWPFDGSAAGGSVVWRAQAVLEGRELGQAVCGDLLTGFSVPERLLGTESL